MPHKEMLPILYSFRRCPYAMRARMALHYAKINCILREVDLKNKPDELIKISPKATVPVLVFSDGNIIDESLDVVHYALNQNEKFKLSKEDDISAKELVSKNDTEFVKLLVRYKYHERYPDESRELNLKKIEDSFLSKYEKMLKNKDFFFGKKSFADIAIVPFIRQFAFADKEWFFSSKYHNIIKWLNIFLEEDGFEDIVMAKNTPWTNSDSEIYFL